MICTNMEKSAYNKYAYPKVTYSLNCIKIIFEQKIIILVPT